jgi:hypothetical protein
MVNRPTFLRPTDPHVRLPRLSLAAQPIFVDAGGTQGERAINVQVFQMLGLVRLNSIRTLFSTIDHSI